MRRLSLLIFLLATVACPRDRKETDSIPTDSALVLDTVPADLSGVTTSLPPAVPDTFKARQPTSAGGAVSAPDIPVAPSPLQEAANREQSVSRFCYREFGLKSDPTLAGNVGMVVTVGQSGISNVRVGRSRWSSRAAGNQVDACLNERLAGAWKLAPGAVRPGTYQLQLTFSGG
jgi:hypothetical protein